MNKVLISILLLSLFLLGGCNKETEEVKVEKKKPEKTETVEVNKEELSNLINNYLNENQLDQNSLAICVYNFKTKESYELNGNIEFTAASLYKLPLAMAYYDKLNSKQLSLDTAYEFNEKHYEPVGVIAEKFPYGTFFTLETLLNYVIVYSDNCAGHILYENLGGWIAYKEEITKYTTHELSANYYTYDNIVTANYMNDVLSYLYNNQDKYQTLIDNLYEAQPNTYLNKFLNEKTAQKYGLLDPELNAAGLVLGDNPYSICILSYNIEDAETHIGKLNQIIYEYFN